MGFTAAFGALTIISMSEARKRERRVTRKQEEAQAAEAATRANEARKARRAQVREARIRQAEAENIVAVGGATGSSAAVAAQQSLQAQLGTNIGDIQESLQLGSRQSRANQAILDAQRKGGVEILSTAGINILGASKGV